MAAQPASAATTSTPSAPTQASAPQPQSLAEILDGPEDDAATAIDSDSPNPQHGADDEDDADDDGRIAQEGYCVECEDQLAETYCEQCADSFCDVCFTSVHRKGTRKLHKRSALKSARRNQTSSSSSSATAIATPNGTPPDGHAQDSGEMDVDEEDSDHHTTLKNERTALLGAQPDIGEAVGDWFIERAKYTPVRLSMDERKLLRLLEAALEVSEYTDKIDILSYTSKPKRMVAQIKELCSILSGLVIASDYKRGQELFAKRDFEANEEFFQTIFEIGRRHKILNPDKSRTTYGKLMYILQDSQLVEDTLGFNCVAPLKTVYDLLKSHNALDVLKDDRVSIATKEILSEGRGRREIQSEIRSKERAIEALATKYATASVRRGGSEGGIDAEAIRQCLYSIGDNHAFLRTNRDPCDRMIVYLKKYFDPESPGSHPTQSLAIRSGRGGARLSHDHSKQYSYVLQSLTLWREILHDMFRLWSLAEQDLLSTSTTYRLRDTGQGLNRVQYAPKTARLMQLILQRAQKSIGYWVGSSVIHMGDHNVPNAFLFIDKYSQVYRILLPICTTLSQIPELEKKPAIKKYIDAEFGGTDALMREVLCDFFRHGFDGSGADNSFDAGSCIDGRLTSAWNWCSSLEKKRYFQVFLLCGFTGFDGDW